MFVIIENQYSSVILYIILSPVMNLGKLKHLVFLWRDRKVSGPPLDSSF